MKFFVPILLFSLSCIGASETPSEGRFLWATSFMKSTQKVVVKTTVTLPSFVTEMCVSTTDAITACRRRRGVEEQPFLTVDDVELQPTQVLSVENTEIAMTEDKTNTEVELTGSQMIDNDEMSSRSASPDPFIGMNLLVRTTSLTEILTETVFAPINVITKTFYLGGCMPKALETFSACQVQVSGSDSAAVIVATAVQIEVNQNDEDPTPSTPPSTEP